MTLPEEINKNRAGMARWVWNSSIPLAPLGEGRRNRSESAMETGLTGALFALALFRMSLTEIVTVEDSLLPGHPLGRPASKEIMAATCSSAQC
jgi:hypothetical protein